MSKKKIGRESLPFAPLAAIAKDRQVRNEDVGVVRVLSGLILKNRRLESKGNARYIETEEFPEHRATRPHHCGTHVVVT